MKSYLKSFSLFLICFLLLFSLQNVYAICPVQLIVKKEYHFESSGTSTTVTIPEIKGIEDSTVTKEVNQLIQDSVDDYLQQVKEYDQSYNQINDSQVKKWLIDINYQTYYADCNFISFSKKSTRHFRACSHNFPKAGEARFQGRSRLFRLLGKFPYLGESRRILMAVSSKTSSKMRFTTPRRVASPQQPCSHPYGRSTRASS